MESKTEKYQWLIDRLNSEIKGVLFEGNVFDFKHGFAIAASNQKEGNQLKRASLPIDHDDILLFADSHTDEEKELVVQSIIEFFNEIFKDKIATSDNTTMLR